MECKNNTRRELFIRDFLILSSKEGRRRAAYEKKIKAAITAKNVKYIDGLIKRGVIKGLSYAFIPGHPIAETLHVQW